MAQHSASPLEDAIRNAVAAEVRPLRAELERLRLEVEALRRALPPALVSVEIAAEMMGVCLSTARRRVKDGSWPVRRDGRRVLVDLAKLHGPTEGEIEAAVSLLQGSEEVRRTAS